MSAYTISQHWLDNLNIKELNPMQLETITAINNNNELILLSATGSGKTIAFLLPLIQSLDPEKKNVQALIMVPSRELALQIESVLKLMQTGFKVTACYGGHKREIEENSLVEAPAIIVGTAGRLADHIRRKNFDTKGIEFLVLDEFDKSLELGFLEEMEYILGSLPNIQKKMLTSATQSPDMPAFVGLKDPQTLNFLSEDAGENESLRIHTVLSPEKDKLQTLFEMVCFFGNTSTIIFCNHRDSVERTSQFLTEQGIVNVFYHGGMEQHDREVALTKFRNSSSDLLVTTDLASRGLDIAHIRNIVHYHIPLDESAFTHRNGRTARMNETGNVYVIWSAEEKLPAYLTASATAFEIPEKLSLPEKPKWSTLFIAAGKKNKISKGDVAGFLMKNGHLKKEDVGLIDIRDFASFAAVRKSKVGQLMEEVKNEKIKNMKVKIAVAK